MHTLPGHPDKTAALLLTSKTHNRVWHLLTKLFSVLLHLNWQLSAKRGCSRGRFGPVAPQQLLLEGDSFHTPGHRDQRPETVTHPAARVGPPAGTGPPAFCQRGLTHTPFGNSSAWYIYSQILCLTHKMRVTGPANADFYLNDSDFFA